MRHTFRQVLILTLVILFALSVTPNVFSKGASRSSSRSYSGRSASKSYNRTYSTPSRSSSSLSRSTQSTVRKASSPAGQRSSTKSYSQSAVGASQRSTGRQSSAVRQKQSAMSRANTGSAVSTRGMTSRDKRGLQSGRRKEVRNLKAENRRLKHQVRSTNRDTARARRQAREAQSPITVNNFGGFYPNAGYSMFSLTASMVFANMVSGIFFHDHYNHMMHRSWLWYYHHPNYDRSHWPRERQMEHQRWQGYYDSQGIEKNPNYVDPGINRDEDYIESYVEKNPDKFYGSNAEAAVTVEELPDESALRDVVLASGETPRAAVKAQPQRVIVDKKTSGGTWFVLVFGSVLIIGIIILIMYNKGYF